MTPGVPISLTRSEADPGVAESGTRGRPAACDDADAADGHGDDLPQTAYEHPGAAICGLPMPAHGTEDRAAQSRLGGRSDVPADGTRVPVSGSHHRRR